MIFRHAALSTGSRRSGDNLDPGKFDRDSIVKAIRKLEKVQKERGGSRSFVTEEESFAEFADEEESSEEYIYVGEKDLEEILDEEEVQEAPASYQQVQGDLRSEDEPRVL